MKSHQSLHRFQSWTARIVAGLGLCVALSAWADDAAPGAQRAAATVTTSTTSNAPSTTATVTSSASAPTPRVICFQNSIRCFTAKAPIDLRAPAITRVFSEAELQEKLPDADEIHEPATVQVQGERQVTPVSVGLMAIPWAIVHPTQAWRILMPVQEAK